MFCGLGHLWGVGGMGSRHYNLKKIYRIKPGKIELLLDEFCISPCTIKMQVYSKTLFFQRVLEISIWAIINVTIQRLPNKSFKKGKQCFIFIFKYFVSCYISPNKCINSQFSKSAKWNPICSYFYIFFLIKIKVTQYMTFKQK